jgi:hypothetical protein
MVDRAKGQKVMSEHPELWWILAAVAGGFVSLLLKMAFEYLKNKSGGDLSRVILNKVETIDSRTLLMEKNLDHGVSVAERNTDSYHEFIIALNDLKNMIKADTDATKELVKEIKAQTKILTEIKNNGNGKK